MGHAVILLFECDDKSMNIFDFVFENINQALDGSLLLNQIIAETRSIDHGKNRPAEVSQKVALIFASFLGWARKSVIVLKEASGFDSNAFSCYERSEASITTLFFSLFYLSLPLTLMQSVLFLGFLAQGEFHFQPQLLRGRAKATRGSQFSSLFKLMPLSLG